MGKQLDTHTFTRQDRARYREKVRSCLDVFALMLNDFAFDSDKPLTGLEVEISLVDDDANPAMCNADVLARVDDPMLQAELGRFNLEMNVPPRLLAGDGFDDGPAHAKVDAAGHPTPMWSVDVGPELAVFVGEAKAAWMWALLWPAAAGVLLLENLGLHDLVVRSLGADIPFGALMPRLAALRATEV